MKRNFTIFIALVIGFFTLPFGGNTALAEEKVYDLKDGEYEITAKALHASEDKASGAAGFINEDAILSIQNGEIELTITIPHNDMAEIEGLQIEGNEPKVKDEETGNWTYKLDALKTELVSQVQYAVPMFDMKHDVPFRFNLEGLDKIPVKEEEPEQPKPAPEERVVGTQITETEADAVYKLTYETDSNATRGQLLNPVKLLEKADKQYIQIGINERGAQYFRSLKFNGKEVTWNSITEGPYTIQFELPNGIEDELDVSMVIQAGPNVMPHDGIKLWFDEGSLETIKAKPDKPEEIEIEQGAKKPVKANDTIIVKGSKGTQITLPENLPDDVKVTITSKDKEKIENKGDLEIAGEVYDFNFEGIGDFKGNFELVMGYDQDKYPTDKYDVGIYYYDEVKGEWILQKSTVKDGKVTTNVNHFSTYGVFAITSENNDEESVPNPEPNPAPEKKTEINYTVKHATKDETSTADMFFTKPATLFEKDGEKYIQLTVKSWSMIDWLRTDQGDVAIVKTNGDGSVVVQFKVDGPLTDAILLSMSVTVPGVYEGMVHDVRLFLEVDEKGNGGTPIPVPTPTPTPTPKPVPKPKAEVKSEIVPDKVYEIDYVVKHATEDKESAANSFFRKPAHLLYIDGEKYIQLTINDWNMIDWLRTEHGDVIVVKENDDGSALIQFKVDGDLADEILLSMSVTVPGLYSMEHNARLILDVDSLNEVNADDFQIIVVEEGSNPGLKGTEGPGKPEFGNGETTDKNIDGAVKSGKTNNPQTGDTTSIFLYAMLLMGSLVPLAVKLRRRFV